MLDISQYLSPQAILAVTIVGPFIPPVVNQIKPVIDHAINPTTPLHDLCIKGLAILLDFAGVWLFMWLFNSPSSPRELVWGGIAAVISYFTGQAIYLTGRGPVPVTPTDAYIAHVATVHGDKIVAALNQTP